MTRRTAWVTAFLAVTSLAVGAELVAAFDHSDNTVPWTYLVRDHVPWPITALAVGWLVGWLPGHFYNAYQQRKPQPATGGDLMGRYRKSITAGVGVLAQVVQLGLLPPQWQGWATLAISAATLAGVYVVPNAPAKRPKVVDEMRTGRVSS